jgi:hypothetical protein
MPLAPHLDNFAQILLAHLSDDDRWGENENRRSRLFAGAYDHRHVNIQDFRQQKRGSGFFPIQPALSHNGCDAEFLSEHINGQHNSQTESPNCSLQNPSPPNEILTRWAEEKPSRLNGRSKLFH